MFLKVEFTAYFSINGLKIEKKELANDSDSNGIYLNGKKIAPDISYFFEVEKDEVREQVKMPKSMQLELDRYSYKEEFVDRAQIWKEDPIAQRIDESLEQLHAVNSSKEIEGVAH